MYLRVKLVMVPHASPLFSVVSYSICSFICSLCRTAFSEATSLSAAVFIRNASRSCELITIGSLFLFTPATGSGGHGNAIIAIARISREVSMA